MRFNEAEASEPRMGGKYLRPCGGQACFNEAEASEPRMVLHAHQDAMVALALK